MGPTIRPRPKKVSNDACKYIFISKIQSGLAFAVTYESQCDIIGEFVCYNGETGGQEGGIAHSLDDPDDETETDESDMALHFVQ